MLSFSAQLRDARLARRAAWLCQALALHRCVQISKLASDWAEQMAYYRLLDNDRFSPDQIIKALTAHAASLTRSKHAFVIQDTTQFNLERHKRHIEPESGLGVIGDNESLGFFLHASLVVDAATEEATGFSHVKLWSRSATAPDKHARAYKDQPVEQKESYRWIEAAHFSHALLGQVERVTFMADGENDAYDFFARVLPSADVLGRARDDRRITEAPGKLYAFLSGQPLSGSYELALRGDLSRGRKGRVAVIEVRYGRVELRRPAGVKDVPETVRLYAVEARESGVPPGEKAVHWRLLTSHEVASFEQAREVIGWYRLRWHIEQVFRLLKRQGLDVESSALESGQALMKLTLLALSSALDVMRLLLAREGLAEQPIGHVFSEAEVSCLEQVGPTLEGRTEKQRNPHRKRSLAWAAWIIARLGGWKGLASQGKPGPITFHDGLERFRDMYSGWRIYHDVYNT